MDSKAIYRIMIKKCPNTRRNKHYLKRYVRFISACLDKNKNISYYDYTEDHHILPQAKTLWPEFASFKRYSWNKAILTARQHFIAHLILAKTFGHGMWFALHMMTLKNDTQDRYIKMNSLDYKLIRINLSKYQKQRFLYKDHHRKGVSLTKEHRNLLSKLFTGENNPFYGKSHSQESKDKVSKANKGQFSGENNPHYGLKGILSPNYGIRRTTETKEKMSLSRNNINTSQVSCLVCKRTGEYRSMKHYHFENCGKKTHHNTGSNNGRAKTIIIFNQFGFPIHEVKSNFAQKCKDLKLPYKPFCNSYKNNGSPILLSNQSKKWAYRNSKSYLIGWYALEIT